MRVAGIRLFQYRLPFGKPYVTAQGSISHREGVLVELRTSDGVHGLGEAAPRPDGWADIDAFVDRVLALSREVIGRDIEAIIDEPRQQEDPQASAGLEIAARDAMARRRGLPLARFLAASPAPSVPVNALIDASSIDEIVSAALAAKVEGYSSVKLKCGRCATPEAEARRVSAVRDALGPEVALRLDANGAWEEPFALQLLRQLRDCGIDYVEQPLPPGNLEAVARLRRASGVAIAADEDVTSPEAAANVLDYEAADVLVLKPLQVGGFGATIRIADEARNRGVRVVVTTTLDTGVGTAAALHLAVALAPTEAAGLATLSMLASGLVTPPLAVQAGRMALPSGAGLGVTLDRRAVARYTVRVWELTS